MQQRHRVGLGVVDKDLQAGVEGRPLTVRPAREHALEHLLWTQHRHHLQDEESTTRFIPPTPTRTPAVISHVLANCSDSENRFLKMLLAPFFKNEGLVIFYFSKIVNFKLFEVR